MSNLFTLMYAPDTKDNWVPEGKLKVVVDNLVAIVNGGIGHKVVTVCQQLVIDEMCLRVAKGEFQCPVEVRFNSETTPQWCGIITQHGTLPPIPWVVSSEGLHNGNRTD